MLEVVADRDVWRLNLELLPHKPHEERRERRTVEAWLTEENCIFNTYDPT